MWIKKSWEANESFRRKQAFEGGTLGRWEKAKDNSCSTRFVVDNPGCETCPANIWNQSLPHTQCLKTAGFMLLSIKVSAGVCANFRREVILLLTFCRVGLSFLSRNILEGAFIINLGLNVWMENWQVPFFWFNHSFPFHEKTTVYTGWSLRTMGFIFSILKASLTLLSQRRTYNYF